MSAGGDTGIAGNGGNGAGGGVGLVGPEEPFGNGNSSGCADVSGTAMGAGGKLSPSARATCPSNNAVTSNAIALTPKG
jgi:hypothetical protein